MTKTPAQGPYEVVTVIDEEGKARGKNGEQWILIRNADGAIATVYPGREAPETAKLLAASWDLLKQLKLARSVAEDRIAMLENSYSPEPNAEQAEEIAEARAMWENFDAAIAQAQGVM